MESVTIDFDKMPEKEKRVLGDTLYAACKAFYENPDNLARYNAWKAKREAASHFSSWSRSLCTTP